MTINQARQILNFIKERKTKKMMDEDIVWELANEFNVNLEPTETAMKIKTNNKENINDNVKSR